MSKLSQLVGKSKTFTIAGIELEIKPRTVEDIDLIMELADESKKAAAMKEIVKRTLKDAVPDATDEEINQIGFEHFNEITKAIVEVNGLDAKTA